MSLEALADLITTEYYSVAELENMYPSRNLEEGQMVTRFAPSPTGFLHTGSLFTAYLNYKFARDSKGIFYLRIEDTDQEREVEGSTDILKSQLENFGITYQNDETYAPYTQSERKKIYDSVIHELILRGRAYPCFATKEELEALKDEQIKNNEKTGYYGKYAKYRDYDVNKAIELIKKGTPYVVRFKSEGKRFDIYDELRGKINLLPNDYDIVIRKADGLPTYHFAHCCDDHYMRTTHVIRGEEWLASLPIHYELFDACGFSVPKYLHLPTIMKSEDGKRRKLSKRKDPEASVTYLLESGYPKNAILEYLLTLANSNFESWLNENPLASLDEFKLSFKGFSLDGALFDLDKLSSISKEWISKTDAKLLVNDILDYAKTYNNELYDYINCDIVYFTKIISIGKNLESPRKDYSKYSEILPKIGFFYNDYYEKLEEYNHEYPSDLCNKVLNILLNSNYKDEESVWLNNLKEASKELGFAKNKKEAEKLGVNYMFADFMNIIRIAICKDKNSPNLYDILNIMDESIWKSRINKFLQ